MLQGLYAVCNYNVDIRLCYINDVSKECTNMSMMHGHSGGILDVYIDGVGDWHSTVPQSFLVKSLGQSTIAKQLMCIHIQGYNPALNILSDVQVLKRFSSYFGDTVNNLISGVYYTII